MSTKLTLKPCTYFYGYTSDEVKTLAEMPYKQAIEKKIADGKKLLERLASITFLQQDSARITDVAKAIKFNYNLLKELEWFIYL